MADHPYRGSDALPSVRRAWLLAYGPLAAAMLVMALAGVRAGLSIDTVSKALSSALPTDAEAAMVVGGIVAGTWLAAAVHVNRENPAVTRWMVACFLSLIFGLTLGSWP